MYDEISIERYKCYICGKRDAKLWRPTNENAPLICAECAEKYQSKLTYEERIWHKEHEGESGCSYRVERTGKMLPLPKWTVNTKGKVPSYYGPGPDGQPLTTTDKLIVDLPAEVSYCEEKKIEMVPAYPEKEGAFYNYDAPRNIKRWWETLPTR